MNANPSEVLATLPAAPSREQTEKTVMDKYPGHIAWATDRANFAGCRAIRFATGGCFGLEQKDAAVFAEQCVKAGLGEDSPAEEFMNLYFSFRANLLIVQMGYAEDEIAAFITTQLDEEDLEDFEAARQANQVAMREARAKRAERHAEARRAVLEEKRLAEVGRKYEENLKNNLPKEKELA